ncbi:pyruvate:ferredoxin (flavodoxin) oxidoreductase [Oscillospiraceae bacterium Marseille-Q3528]|nr:pyruvate:ferredoxin (flavodoxin) oxidoreductase [Oscillospiraceae bacterium Marseille-Q3528]
MDGNTAAAHVAYAFSEVAAIYPITPSSPMAENMDEWVSQDRTNIFGEKVNIVEMQSEAGAAGAVHGSITAGSYTSTFTASQGLLLMIPNMYKLAGEQTPTVFHVAARALASHALSIFGDHSDVMACRQTGFAMLASNSVQQAMDLAAVAHLSTIAGHLPMMHFFDGFRTSHEYQKIEVWDYDDLKEMVDWDAVKAFKARSLNPNHPHLMGSAEQPETFFQHREASNPAYLETPDLVAKYMDKVNAKIGTDYKPFNYYGAEDATEIIVAMGSVCDAAEELIDYLTAQGRKVGMIEVHLYRPFSQKYLLNVMPKTVKKIAVLDRTKEPGSIGEPLYLDIVAALHGTEFENCTIVGGRYGLGSKDTQPGDILAVYENLWSENPKKEFTISINDDVTHLSLPTTSNPDVAPKGTKACKFWGLGADGTVGANKNSVKIIGDHTDKKVQAYFQYDSKKSGGVTISHLRFGDSPIKSTYYVKQADFVACHNSAYLYRYEMVQDVKPGGFFLLNCVWSDEELEEHLPAKVKRYIANNNVQFYTCDAVSIAKKIGLGARRTNSVLQAAFFKLANIIPIDDAVGYMKDAIRHTYGKKGEDIVNMNLAAVDAGVNHIHKVVVPESWKTAADEAPAPKLVGRDKAHTDYLNDILVPTNTLTGDAVPVSTFLSTVNGMIPSGTAAFEKRGIAADLPKWDFTKCMQCNWCSYVCPHGVIRPFVLNDAEAEGVDGVLNMKGTKDKKFTIAISALDCTGCGSCAQVCPAREKALEMIPAETEYMDEQQAKYNGLFGNVTDKEIPFKEDTVKGSQFRQPLMEFSGACPGCGESPYAKLITQLFGERMFIANATGCSSIWGCSAPSSPYTVNKEGKGPAWANSLFEDNAEFGFGMTVSVEARRNELKSAVERLNDVLGVPARAWLASFNDAKQSKVTGDILLAECEKIQDTNADAKYVVENQDMLNKPSMWIFGGDGWAYDIGYGGVDHVLASGRNINVMVFDTEVYSNTGGQSSKSTPMGAVAKFAASGKAVKKKDLAQIAMAYGYVYVAQIAMGANPNQTLQALREAEAYDGPSLIIAYAPCINHGVKAGMNKAMLEMKNAVRSGYWNLLRYNPTLAAEGKNPLSIDSGVATESYRDFIMGEVRYNSLKLKFPDRAEQLFTKAEELAHDRYDELITRRDSFSELETLEKGGK